ncbi:Fur family transcriptional regulator [Haloechinothrix sp. LS1_15]|uniref:Fur family transcriptional regulator n=1 Tax=Haloechinothrix sp. LS1_15 TaxID=2652248 RepID=UPI0029472428|nr:Fur family transcriptional regulator [Haloechinothrix sp. LS1_15]MDV6014651.1 transcriptional repressor [Haloechinothrix sp. LS1_15]
MPLDGVSERYRLRQAGLRVTGPRLAILEWLAEHPHATADEIGNGVRDHLRSVSTQAVYDVLSACSDAGLVRRIEPAGHPARFECRTGDNHHHLVCRGCGRISDVDCIRGNAPCIFPDDTQGYEIDEAELVFWGRCFHCSNPTAAGAEDTSPISGTSHHEEARR